MKTGLDLSCNWNSSCANIGEWSGRVNEGAEAVRMATRMGQKGNNRLTSCEGEYGGIPKEQPLRKVLLASQARFKEEAMCE